MGVEVVEREAFFGCEEALTDVECGKLEIIGECAFAHCKSLRSINLPSAKIVKWWAFIGCEALTVVECGKLEIIEERAFGSCNSLMSINLPSAKIVKWWAFFECAALTNVKFGKKLESIGNGAFDECPSLERITIPLKDGMIAHDSIFRGCENLKQVDLVEEAVLRDTIAALLLEEWKHDMEEKIDSINQILPTTPAGGFGDDDGGKARAIRSWISSVLSAIIHYKAQHRSYLNEAATTLQLASPNDVVLENVLPFLKLPSYTFEGED